MNHVPLECLSETLVEADWLIGQSHERQTIEHFLKSARSSSLFHRICAKTSKNVQLVNHCWKMQFFLDLASFRGSVDIGSNIQPTQEP